jgi:hypothetical protein
MRDKCPFCKEKFRGYHLVLPGFFAIHQTKTATFNKLDTIMVCTSTWITGRSKKEWSKSLYTAPEAFWMGSGLIQASLLNPKFFSYWQAEQAKAHIKPRKRK